MKNQDHEMKKMKFSDETNTTQYKKKPPQRPSIVSNYSFVSLSEVTEGSLQVWRTLPEKIRQDPSLASFRQEHERLHGKFQYFVLFLALRREFHDVTNFSLFTRAIYSNLLTEFQSAFDAHLFIFLIWAEEFTSRRLLDSIHSRS